jgi:Uncharacterized conserved protein
VQDMCVAAVGMDLMASQPVLMLRETTGRHRVLPVWVGFPEASAIESERQHVPSPRPGTHQLIAQVISACGRRLQRVTINLLRDNVFHAELVLDQGGIVSARVSDAIVLALHLDIPIQATDAVLDQAAIADLDVITAAQIAGTAGRTEADPDQITELEQFRQFLDTATPEDFAPE